MEVPRSYLDGYDDALNVLRDRAKSELAASLRMVDYSADPERVREAVLDIMQACCGGASEMAAMQSSIFYDGLRERVVGDAMGAYAQDMRSSIGTDKAVRAFLEKLFDGDYDGFEELCLERIDYEITASAGRCMAYNARQDPDRPRYARVPQGEKTCDFCLMLASRGPVYWSEESAGAFTKFHAHCDCKILPFWGSKAVVTDSGGVIRRGGTSYEGYDPDKLFDKYLELMLKPEVAERMKRASELAHERHGSNWGGWGKTSAAVMSELFGYIGDATSYEDLCARLQELDKLNIHPTEKQYQALVEHARAKRRQFVG